MSNKKTAAAPSTLSQLEGFEASELPELGWIRILEVGEENMLFKFWRDGRMLRGVCKVASWTC